MAAAASTTIVAENVDGRAGVWSGNFQYMYNIANAFVPIKFAQTNAFA